MLLLLLLWNFTVDEPLLELVLHMLLVVGAGTASDNNEAAAAGARSERRGRRDC